MAKISAFLDSIRIKSMHTSWFAMSSAIPSSAYANSSAYRSDWTNKRSNKGFYTFTTDRTPGGYIG